MSPETVRYTWHRPAKKAASHIDMILGSSGLCDMLTETDILPGIRTDHSLVYAIFKLDKFTRGPGTWKLNTKLLCEENFISGVREALNNTKNLYQKQAPD